MRYKKKKQDKIRGKNRDHCLKYKGIFDAQKCFIIIQTMLQRIRTLI